MDGRPPSGALTRDPHTYNVQRGRGAKKEEEGQGAAANSTAATPMAVQAAVRSYLLDIFRSDDSIPPLMVRLAWHDAGTYVWMCVYMGRGGLDQSSTLPTS